MVVVILGVVNVFPVPNKFPPVGASYQFIVPNDAIALNITVPESHREEGVDEVIVGIGLIVAVITDLVGVVHRGPIAST